MNQSDHIDDQVLQAFVDNQLDMAHCEIVMDAMEADVSVRDRVYRLRRTKDLMRLAFEVPRKSQETSNSRLVDRWKPAHFGLAASVLVLLTSLASGLFGYQYRGHTGAQFQQVAQAAEQFPGDKVILHISESDPNKFAAALIYAREFLASHDAEHAQIEVVANSGGLDLMRMGVSPVERQLVSLVNEYDNVSLIACAYTVSDLRYQGIEPLFIKEVESDRPAIDRVVERLQQGWSYVKVDSRFKGLMSRNHLSPHAVNNL